MDQRYQKLMDCYACFQKKISFVPQVALVLGSGLGDYANDIKVVAELDYKEIDGFPTSTVQGHEGKYIFGYVGTVPVVCMKGRVHYYEGYDISDVVLPIRLMKLMGAKVLFLTNASGGINTEFRAGDLMLIQDQISDFVPSPLIGANMEELGTRFPDMSEIYDKKLQQIIKKTAAVNDIPLEQGVYIQLTGPNFESPAEVAYVPYPWCRCSGMSTACEAVAANHMRMHICGISCIANMACGITPNPLTHKEVQEAADRVAPRFKKLVTKEYYKYCKKKIPLGE